MQHCRDNPSPTLSTCHHTRRRRLCTVGRWLVCSCVWGWRPVPGAGGSGVDGARRQAGQPVEGPKHPQPGTPRAVALPILWTLGGTGPDPKALRGGGLTSRQQRGQRYSEESNPGSSSPRLGRGAEHPERVLVGQGSMAGCLPGTVHPTHLTSHRAIHSGPSSAPSHGPCVATPAAALGGRPIQLGGKGERCVPARCSPAGGAWPWMQSPRWAVGERR